MSNTIHVSRSGLFPRMYSVGTLLVVPAARQRWRIIARDGSTVAVRDTFRRAVLRAIRAAREG